MTSVVDQPSSWSDSSTIILTASPRQVQKSATNMDAFTAQDLENLMKQFARKYGRPARGKFSLVERDIDEQTADTIAEMARLSLDAPNARVREITQRAVLKRIREMMEDRGVPFVLPQ